MKEGHSSRKRKLQDAPEIEVDPSAPEPLSKKALRKAKKKGIELVVATTGSDPPSPPSTPSTPSRPSSQPQRSAYGIWIGNLPFSATKDDLRQFFTARCSFTETSIVRIHLPTEKKNGKAVNKGFAYVDFSHERAADEAHGLGEQLLSGRRVLIKGARDFDGRPEQHQSSGASPFSTATVRHPSKRIFIGNLGFDATKEMLEDHFSQCGAVTNAHVATFEDSGKCKGFAWVEFEQLEAAQAAVKGVIRVEGTASEDDQPSQPKKPKTQKIWINRFLGRQLRMEFAEDATTRYKKRFGKDVGNRRRDSGASAATQHRNADGATDGDAVGHGQHAPGKRLPRNQPAPKQTPPASRYSRETVQRLSGAIVESQGCKIMFD
jgi:RNA recognition motif. (a.k.a. RRM, RBD, or RNP domain)